jgi:hypothetical protein
MNSFVGVAEEAEEGLELAKTYYAVVGWHRESCEGDPRCDNLGCGTGSTQDKANKRAWKHLKKQGEPVDAAPLLTEIGTVRNYLYNNCVNQDRTDIIGGLPF